MLGLNQYDIKVIRQEGEDTRAKIELLREDIRETRDLLRSILTELIKINVNTTKRPHIGPG